MAKDKEVAVVKDASVDALISQAIVKGADVSVMERLLAMRDKIRAEKAKEAYDLAMADFQAQCPTIHKTKEVTTSSGKRAYAYAPIESIVTQVKRYLESNGFSYSFKQELKTGGVKVICVVKHSAGHMEEYSMEVPFGSKTQVMSDSQVAAAASTFAKRYAFCNAFGILTSDEDTDGADFDKTPIPAKAKVTSTGDDTTIDPVKAEEKRKNEEIRKLAESIRGTRFETQKEYWQWLEEETGFRLSSRTLDGILKALQAKEGAI